VTDFDVVGLGSFVLDRLHPTARILGPDEKGPLVLTKERGSTRIQVGGVLLNQLGWASALGLRTALVGRGAADSAGRVLRAAMDRAGIEARIVLDGRASAVADIFVDPAGERAIYYDAAGTAEVDPDLVARTLPDLLRRASRFSTEIHQVPLAAVRDALSLARELGVATSLDLDEPPSAAVPHLGTRGELDAALGLADLLKPSLPAARELAPDAGDDALAVACALREQLGCQAVAVTDGARGCGIATAELEVTLPAYGARVADSTGAGDAFFGGLLAGLYYGLSWQDAGRLANACGASCVEQWGGFPENAARARADALERYDGSSFEANALAGTVGRADATASALDALEASAEGLVALRERFAPDKWRELLEWVDAGLRVGGRVHVTGVGKPEHIARYGASLLSSIGVPATFLHATETVHGSAGQVDAGDLVIAISNSGSTPELLAAIDALRPLGARILAVTADLDSPLAERADRVLDAVVAREGGGLGWAPRASAAAELVVLAALSAGLERLRNLTPADYHLRHPAGRLGELSKHSRD